MVVTVCAARHLTEMSPFVPSSCDLMARPADDGG